MIFSAVVSNGIIDGAARWVQEPKNPINVAITRARQSLYVVADYHYCSRCTGILKTLPWSAVWYYYCMKQEVPVGLDWFNEVKQYETDILSRRE